MTNQFFKKRHNLNEEYSGYEEVSDSLREKIVAIVKENSNNRTSYNGRRKILLKKYKYELKIQVNNEDYKEVMLKYPFKDVFEAVEIFLSRVNQNITDRQTIKKIKKELQEAFKTSGSVYHIEDSKVKLKVDEDTANNLKETEEVLKKDEDDLYQKFRDIIGDFLARKEKPQNTIKDMYIILEKYIKQKTNKEDFSSALAKLKEDSVINKIQKSILGQLQQYRNESYEISHDGNLPKPDKIDGLWFIETTAAQIKLLHKKLKNE